MGKKHYAELREIRCYCSKCYKEFSVNLTEIEFDGWSSSDGLISAHGGSSMSFTCNGCKNLYSITLNEY